MTVQIDSFLNIVFPEDPSIWKTHIGPVGAIKAWLLADRKEGNGPSYLSQEVRSSASLAFCHIERLS